MKVRYIGESSIRYGDIKIDRGGELDLPENVAAVLINTGNWELATSRKSKKSKKATEPVQKAE
mgnify:CR=1 FL=1